MLHPVILTKARPSGKETRYAVKEAAGSAPAPSLTSTLHFASTKCAYAFSRALVAYLGTNLTANPKLEALPCRMIANKFF